jgi:hypothetical protein
MHVRFWRLMHCNKIRGDAHVLPRLFVLILNANINAALRLPVRNQIYCFDRPANRATRSFFDLR